MNAPNPTPTGWKPTASTLAGGGLGLCCAQLIVAGIQAIFHTTVSAETGVSLGMVCTALLGYLFPDGGRK